MDEKLAGAPAMRPCTCNYCEEAQRHGAGAAPCADLQIQSKREIASLVVFRLKAEPYWTVHSDFVGLSDEQLNALYASVCLERIRRRA
jgi:hypothetical protein